MRRILVISIAVLVLGAACSSSESETTTTAPLGTSTTSGEGATTSSSTTTVAVTTTTTAAETSCVVGLWVLDSEDFFEQVLDDLGDDAPDGTFAYVGGEFRLQLDVDGTVVEERDEWTFGLLSDEGLLEVSVSDRRVGTYSYDGATLTAQTEAAGQRRFTVLIDGVPLDIPEDLLPIEPPHLSLIDAQVACSGDTMAATVDGVTSKWESVG